MSYSSDSLPTWDLSPLYAGLDDPQIKVDQETSKKLTVTFTEKYKETINQSDLSAEHLLAAIGEYEEILLITTKLSVFASLVHSVNSTDESVGRFYQQVNEFTTHLLADVTWFQLEWIELEDDQAEKVRTSPLLSKYSHYLQHLRVFKPYTLPEKEEQLLQLTSQTGSDAFIRLYDETDARMQFPLTVDGEEKMLSFSELRPYLNDHPDRALRKAAAHSLSKTLKENQHLYTFILNTLLYDSAISDEIRGYDYPQQQTFLSYELQTEVVNALTKAVEDRYDISSTFYDAKKQMLGEAQLFEWDRYSVISSESTKQYTWNEARDLILTAFRSFSPIFADTAQLFFDNNWIDAQVVSGKRAGAYCSLGLPSLNPYVFVNFTGTTDDVMTLAHELGHGVHAYLARDCSMLEFWPSTSVCEIASVFAEMVVFDHLYQDLQDPKQKQLLLTQKIQSVFATVFRQVAFYLFEEDIHTHRREQGELTTKEFGEYFQARLQPMFGDSLTLTDDHAYWWMPVLHFYHYDFYVFTYAFGELLTLALYAQYKEKGEAFVTSYLSALARGGSVSPFDVVKEMGLDITDPDFWRNGFVPIEKYVKEFQEFSASSHE